MSTTKTLDITLNMPEQSNPTDIKTKKISIPFEGTLSNAQVVTRVKEMSGYLTTPSTLHGQNTDGARGIAATFKETVVDGADTYVYIPKSITKAEIVTTTEDIIYGN